MSGNFGVKCGEIRVSASREMKEGPKEAQMVGVEIGKENETDERERGRGEVAPSIHSITCCCRYILFPRRKSRIRCP